MESEVSGMISKFDLVRDGLSTSTRRDLKRPRHWRGLTAVDAGLLAVWVRDHLEEIGELHTDVVCGLVPVLEEKLDTAVNRACVRGLHPLRIDACAWFQMGWWILECKPDAGHQALGQILSYGYWGPLGNRRLYGARVGIITDRAQDVIKPVCEVYDVTVFEGGAGDVG